MDEKLFENIAQFKWDIDTHKNHIHNRKEIYKHGHDCVANALQQIGIINEDEANIMRIITRRIGITNANMITDIMNMKNHSTPECYRLVHFDNFIDFKYTITNNLKDNHCVFCGIHWKIEEGGGNHAFIISKYKDTYYLIDPQVYEEFGNITTLTNENNSYLDDGIRWTIIMKYNCVNETFIENFGNLHI